MITYLSVMCDFFFFCNVKIDMIIIPYTVLNKDDDDDDDIHPHNTGIIIECVLNQRPQ